MKAMLNGLIGTAVLWDAKRVYSLHLDGPDGLVPRKRWEVPHLLGEGRDLRVMEDVTRQQVLSRLRLLYEQAEALDMALFLLDGELSRELRGEAAQALDEALAQPALGTYVEGVLYARPLPPSVDASGALEIVEELGLGRPTALLRDLIERQKVVDTALRAWNEIPDMAFSSDQAQQQEWRTCYRSEAAERSVFNRLVLGLVNDDMDGFRFDALTLLKGLPNNVQIVNEWARLALQHQGGYLPRHDELEPQEPESEDYEVLEADEKPTARRGFDRKAAYNKAVRQKDAIRDALHARQFDRVEEYVGDLIAHHQRHGGGEYAAKSLCDLAMEAKRLGNTHWWLRLTELALEANPEDGWAWAQRGDALLHVHKHDEAMRAYAMAEDYGRPAIAQTGRAEVLKAMYRLPEALAAYEAIIAEHPQEIVAKNGRAEVLKAMYRLDDALSAYEAIIAEHPQEIVAKNGRAEVLKAMYRLPEALAAYEAIIAEHPQEIVAKAGRAEVLKAMYRLPEALAAYEAIIAEHPEDVVAKAGRAEVLKAMYRLDEPSRPMRRSSPSTLKRLWPRMGVLKCSRPCTVCPRRWPPMRRSSPSTPRMWWPRMGALKCSRPCTAWTMPSRPMRRSSPSTLKRLWPRMGVLKCSRPCTACLRRSPPMRRSSPSTPRMWWPRMGVLKCSRPCTAWPSPRGL